MADLALQTQRYSGPTTIKAEPPERRESRLIFAVTLVFFLIEAALSLLLPRTWRQGPSRRFRSIVAEARETADMGFPLSLMR